MLILVVIIYVTMIFPISLRVEASFTTEGKKVFLNVELYNLIKIISGHCVADKNGLSIGLFHNSVKITVPYDKLLGANKKMKLFKSVNVTNVYSLMIIGVENDLLKSVGVAFACSVLTRVPGFLITIKKPRVRYYNDVVSMTDNSFFDCYVSVSLIFNFVSIAIVAIKLLLEKLICKPKKAVE